MRWGNDESASQSHLTFLLNIEKTTPKNQSSVAQHSIQNSISILAGEAVAGVNKKIIQSKSIRLRHIEIRPLLNTSVFSTA